MGQKYRLHAAGSENQQFGGSMKIPRSPIRKERFTTQKQRQGGVGQKDGLDDYKFETNFDPFDTVGTIGTSGSATVGESTISGTTVSDSPIVTIKEDKES